MRVLTLIVLLLVVGFALGRAVDHEQGTQTRVLVYDSREHSWRECNRVLVDGEVYLDRCDRVQP